MAHVCYRDCDFIFNTIRTQQMPSTTNKARLTPALFLNAHRQTLESITDLFTAIEEIPISEAADTKEMKRLFDELSDVRVTIYKNYRSHKNKHLQQKEFFGIFLNRP